MRRITCMVVAVFVLASAASAQDRGQAAQAAHDVMRKAMLARISAPRDLPMRPDAMMSRGTDAAAKAAATAHDHVVRMRQAEAEQAAHSRAAANGRWQPGAARREQDRRPVNDAMRGGSMGRDSGHMGCDATSNSRIMEMHQWWGGGGGMGGGGCCGRGNWPMGLRASPAGTGASSTSAAPPAW